MILSFYSIQSVKDVMKYEFSRYHIITRLSRNSLHCFGATSLAAGHYSNLIWALKTTEIWHLSQSSLYLVYGTNANFHSVWICKMSWWPKFMPNICPGPLMLKTHSLGIESLIIITMTSEWVRWRLRSPASRLFIQPSIQTQMKENMKAPRHWPLWREFTGDQWIPQRKGQ